MTSPDATALLSRLVGRPSVAGGGNGELITTMGIGPIAGGVAVNIVPDTVHAEGRDAR
jgi:hypothetical protein